MASDALSEDDFEAGEFDDDDIDDDDEVEEEEEENTDFIEITDDDNVGAGVSESPIHHIALKIMGYLHDVRTESDKTTFCTHNI